MVTITVNLDPALPREPVSRRILGHFIEHLGKCIKDGLWTYSQTKLPLLAEPPLEQVRVDLFDTMQALRPPVIRWPGGCFSDTYIWTDGIGPREQRPTQRNKYWGGIKSIFWNAGPREKNHFGTDEYLALVAKLGTQPYINVNIKAPPGLAADWVEYANGNGSSPLGQKRAANGHPDPYQVPLWGIGNEVFGWWEPWHAKKSPTYAERYLQFAKAMRARDPSIKLVAVGNSGHSDWNRPLLELIRGYVDFLSIHYYVPFTGLLSNLFGWWGLPANEDVFYAILNSASLFENLAIKAGEDIIATYGEDGLSECKVAFDEWNLWWRYRQVVRADSPPYLLRDGLWSACVLNGFIRQAKYIGMANFAQMVNAIGMILTYKDKVIVNPHYLAFKLYSDAWLDRLLPVTVDSPPLASKKFTRTIPALTCPLLDISAMVSEDGDHVTIFCVNKHFSDAVDATIEFSGLEGQRIASPVTGTVLTHSNPFATNTRKKATDVLLQNFSAAAEKDSVAHIFPPHSATALQFNVA
ncbi:MAG TPA: alpha-L-arabinofuranosidase C-terminal domain-containing protein [Candidatus Lokiarchaeia archaeon]|nr:alpha-L-arabinofuranosidase C-terminal domain-containing protein [Candidatus Lokiarchaeia archaeon]